MKKQFIPLAILLVIMMFLIVGYTNEKELIFPEISALAVGAWVMKLPLWGTTVFRLWLSPSLAALTGVLILKMFPYSPFLMITGAFVLVVVQLKLARSCVLPSISAAILPIITHADSWLYPLSVGVLTGTIAVGRALIIHMSPKEPSSNVPEISSLELSGGLFYWGKVFLGLIIIMTIALQFNVLYMVAPPLIVTFIELSNPNGRLRQRLGKILTVIAFAALWGVLSLYYLHYLVHWPMWVSSGLALVGLFVVFFILKLPFPPAAAICLLPTLLPVDRLWVYPWQVMLGTIGFMLIDVLWFKVKRITVQTDVGIE